MNRIGFFVALALAVVVGVLFGVYARLDLAISALFFDPANHLFRINAQAWVQDLRAGSRGFIALVAAPAFLAVAGKILLPRRRMLIGGRAALFVVLTLALGPGVLTNLILKDHWGRARPIDVTQFGGADRFTPWWDPSGACPDNCSFVAGEPSGAFWTLAPAALAPPQWRVLAYAAALAYGAAVGALRIGAGAHFFTDVVFAGIFMYLVIWAMHGLIFRWHASALADEHVERPLARAGEALRAAARALARLMVRRKDKPS